MSDFISGFLKTDKKINNNKTVDSYNENKVRLKNMHTIIDNLKYYWIVYCSGSFGLVFSEIQNQNNKNTQIKLRNLI